MGADHDEVGAPKLGGPGHGFVQALTGSSSRAWLAPTPADWATAVASVSTLAPLSRITPVRSAVSEVTLEIAPGVQIVSTITSTSAESLKRVEGAKAFGVIKASSVMTGTE